MARKPRVLIVDPDANQRARLAKRLAEAGLDPRPCGSREAALAEARHGPDLAVVERALPDGDGLALIAELRARDPHLQAVVLTGQPSVQSAIEAMKQGAFDYLTRPSKRGELEAVLAKATEKRALARRAAALGGELPRPDRGVGGAEAGLGLIGRSAAMRALQERITAVARARANVFVVGESGTGKELVARAVHRAGPRAARPFVALNCAALSRDLIESELFGHRKGAFTSAADDHAGLFRAAEGGSLFLDEISEMAVGTQAKLLRVLQQKTFRPVGGSREVVVDVRLVASTNRDPEEAVRAGVMRQDLYFRLSVAVLRVPPLRDRIEDVPLLAHHFLTRSSAALGRPISGIDESALELLLDYHWPGNVRELENAMESAATFARGRTIRATDLPLTVRRIRSAPGAPRSIGSPPAPRATPSFDDVVTFDQAHRLLIERALQHCAGNRSRAARRLGISRKQLYAKIEEYGLGEIGRES